MQDRFHIVINTIDEARTIVDAFLKRVSRKYELLNKRNEEKNAAIQKQAEHFNAAEFNEKISGLSEIQKNKLKRIVHKIEVKRHAERGVDTLKQVNPNGYHSNAVSFFLNQQAPMRKNINADKQNQLLTAYRNQDFNNKIFRDPDLIRIAVGLFDNNKLHDAEFETLFIINNARKPLDKKYLPSSEKDFYPIKYYRILDENNEFTEDAKRILLNSLNAHNKYLREDWNEEKIKNFKLIMQAIIEKFPSENIFFTVKSAEFNYDGLALNMTKLSAVLYHGEFPKKLNLIEQLSMSFNGEVLSDKEKIYLSSSVDNAFLLSCYHVNDVVFTRAMSGNLLTLHIERGVEGEVGLRPGAVIYPEVDCNPKIHDYDHTEIADSATYDHDRYHAQLQTRIGESIRLAQERIRHLARTQILMHSSQFEDKPAEEIGSSAIWEHTDSELMRFNFNEENKRPKSYREMVQAFIEALKNAAEDSISHGVDIFFKIKNKKLTNEVTDFGIVWFIDLARMGDEFWRKINFDPSDFPEGAYQTHYQIARELQPYFKYDAKDLNNPDHSKYNIFIFRIYLALGKEHFISFMSFAKDKLLDLLREHEFRRNNEKKFMGLVDKNKKELETSVIINLLLKLLPITLDKPDEKQNNEKYHLLFKIVILIHGHLNHFHYIRQHVLSPLYDLISKLLKNPAIETSSVVDKCFEQLNKFIEYHRKIEKDKKISNELLDYLKEINKTMKYSYGKQASNEYGFAKGFIKAH